MIRTLYSSPGPVEFGRLCSELLAANIDVVDCNEVAGEVAVYTVASVDELLVAQIVAAHSGPPPFPSLDPVGALATLLVVEGVLPLADAANAIHEEPAHLEHEAQAWAL
jgi:hypothetical protein